jgi:hypothetical protein
MKKIIPILISLAVILSCASAAKERSLNKLPDAGFSVQIPDGWWKPEYTNKYFITKDGPFHQYVLIQQRPLDKPFRNTSKKIRSDMLPQETAGVIVDELASDRNLMKFSLIENGPVTVDGLSGFKILFAYKDKKNHHFKTLYYGLISGEYFYNLRYCAALGYYFDQDLADFERIVSSFQLTKK